jgi:hypothetical protein
VELFELLNACFATFKFEGTECYTQVKNVQKRLIIFDCIYKEFSTYLANNYIADTGFDKLKSSVWTFFLLLRDDSTTKLLDFEESYQLLVALLLFVWDTVPQQHKTMDAERGMLL